MDEPTIVWQNQTTEGEITPIQTLRERARQLETRVYWRRFVFAAALTANVLIEVIPRMIGAGRPSLWLGLADVTAFIVWVAYWPYAMVGGQNVTTISAAIGSAPGLAYYRRQLDALLDDYPTKLQIAAIMFAVVVHAASFPLWAVIGILGGIWVYWSRKRETDNARHDLQALREFERQNSL